MTSPLWFLQAANTEGVKPGICTEERKIVLNCVRRDHAIKGIGM
jgi:hypothetical protein